MKTKNLTGPRILFYRHQRGWTQHTLASTLQAMGIKITRCMIANIETQRSTVTDCQIAGIAKALRIPVVLFFCDDKPADFDGALEVPSLPQAVKTTPAPNPQAKPLRRLPGLFRRWFGKH
jgi:transcriptional regulator with XRE-family HTH domain